MMVRLGFHPCFSSMASARISSSSALAPETDRKSTRLNSSHLVISYAVFCLKKKITTLLFTLMAATAQYPFDVRKQFHESFARFQLPIIGVPCNHPLKHYLSLLIFRAKHDFL